MVVVDAGEASVGITNGEIIEVLWSDTSWVPRKHDAGGQSQRRFERGRDEALKHWLRKVVDVVMRHHEGRRLVIGGPGMTKDRFVKELPGYVADKVDRMESCGYTCDAGLYELLGKSRYAKV